jgi:hypothetical protein
MSKIDLSKFELHTAIKEGNSILIIKPNDLPKYESEYFYKDDDDGSLIFKCSTDGAHTENSKYPRTELREKYEWNLLKGTHELEASCIVSKLAGGKGIIFCQVHGDNSKLNPQLCKLYFDTKGNILAEVKNDTDPDSKQIKLQLGKYKLGQRLKILIKIDNGELIAKVNDKIIKTKFKNSYWSKQKFYFKSGNYLQSNIGHDFSIVQFFDLKINHIN